jgi:hypothetical protein
MFNQLLYIDPGSGSYLVQAIIAAVLGAMFYFKTIWWRIKSFFSKSKDEKNTDDPDKNEAPGSQ